MNGNKKTLVEPLLKSGSVYKLKCKQCDSISIQITENNEPDCICLECGGECMSLKLK